MASFPQRLRPSALAEAAAQSLQLRRRRSAHQEDLSTNPSRWLDNVKASKEALWVPQNNNQHNPPWLDDSQLRTLHDHLHHHHHHHDIRPPQQQHQEEQSFPSSSTIPSSSEVGASCHHELLIQTLCQKGQLDRALDVLSHMLAPPSTSTYTSLLKACNKSKALPQARRIHEHLSRHSAQLNGLVGNYLVVTLAKCGDIENACHILVSLPYRTVFSWTTIISAYVDCGHGREALQMHQCMQADGIEPDSFTFASLFKACGSVLDLEQGNKLYAEACKKSRVSDVFVNNTLVAMYGKCGAILEAEDVFARLHQRDVVSWNAMLSAYVEQGQGHKVLLLYRQMQDEGVCPDKHTLVLALQACGILTQNQEGLSVQGQPTHVMCLEIGQALNADAWTKDFASDVFVGTALLSMYGKCGAIFEAEGAFHALSERDIVAWNAILSLYIEQGEGAKALQLYVRVQEEGTVPNQMTLMSALQACCILAGKEEALAVEGQSTKVVSLAIGKALHADADRKGFASNGFVGNTLVSMYAKCAAFVEAEDAFCALSQQDVVSCNVMLSAYIEQGQGEKALQFYRQILVEGMKPDLCMLISAVRACGIFAERGEALVVERQATKVAPLEIGQALHADARKNVFAMDVFLNTTLLTMYGKCGAIVKAEYVISALLQRDTVSWNAMLSVYIEHRQGEKALQVYKHMLEEGIIPDQLTLTCALQACGNIAEKEEALVVQERSTKLMCLEIGQALHADACRMGYALDTLVGTALLSMYGKCGSVVEAEDVFHALSRHDVVSWNAILSVFVEHSQGEKALRLYRDMQKQGMTFSDVTLICILHACRETGSLEVCKQVHFYIVSAGYGRMSSIATTLIHAYGSCASTKDAQLIFDALSEPDFVSWTACFAGHAGEGNSVSCIHMFEKLKLAGIKPDEVMFTSVLSACSHTGLVLEGLEYFESLRRDYRLTRNLKHYGIMVELLGRAGDFKRVNNFLGSMPMQADLTIWLCLLGACHTHSNLELAKQAFDYALNLQPMHATVYVMMANIFAEAGLLECAAKVDHNKQNLGAWSNPGQSWIENKLEVHSFVVDQK